MTDMDEVEAFGHALVVATSIGAGVWIAVAALLGWLS